MRLSSGVVVLAALSAVRLRVALAAPCPNDCSGHGLCDSQTRKCSCFDGYRGYDCRYRNCPFGPQWFGYAHATDRVHDVQTECSSSGECNRNTGECECLPLFDGFACQYLKCASDCSGHGRCMSMREAAAEVNGFSLLRKVLYDEPWDADVLRGCVCDPEWEGYDCSQRRCPRGDDPLTAGQSDEVQLLSCSCPNDECVGDMTLSFYGQASPRINATSVLSVAAEQPDTLASGLARGESVEAKLETIRPLDGVLVEPNATDGPIGWHGSAPLCAPASQGGAVSRITFNEHGGDVPALEVTSAVFGRDNVTGALVAANVTLMHDGQGGSVRGSTEYEVCSGRGVCDHLLGDCLCFDNYFASDGDGQPGSRADCGFASVNISDCPNVLDRCSARGVCDSQRVINGSLLVVDDYAPFVNETFLYKCNCYHGYEGGDCSIQSCPMAPAWFDEASSDNTAHALAPCSNMGHCDGVTGQCICRPGFTGEACERMECPKDRSGVECGGRGRCLTLREAASKAVRHGWRQGQDEVQVVSCSLSDTESFVLELNHHQTFPIRANASEASVRSLLEELPTVGFVQVTFRPGPVACLATGNEIRIQFISHDVDTPQLVATSPAGVANAQLTVETVQNGNRITYGETQGDMKRWDANKITLCDCDGRPNYNMTRPIDATYDEASAGTAFTGYTGAGFDSALDLGRFVGLTCSERPCPHGPDPLGGTEALGQLETQTISCKSPTLAGGNNVSVITLSHMGVSTTPLAINTTQPELKLALERLASVGVVDVAMSDGALCTATGAQTNVTFLTEFGDLPLIRASVSSGEFGEIDIAEAVKGTRENVECNRQGICDKATGLCHCFSHRVSGDGAQSPGRRGDCGGLDHLFTDGA
ncbi:hypothetical protein FNF31_01783 [Cafeteria roenbergensis]|uniref:EGF-like domain-containing protein n=3 Tax=Cafeteria roenbergensis TaxID=33653 RepID=A0A5A8DK87_CAFRO|nr:hypothetical protein FNF31_01783 [Cafeteria roenbergensis]